ncbi:pentatricopeptide repeat-containing protein MRL1, chloroplastic [Rhododendron vialii]|uniref:pentatricopeptide repeat-containing protein MRL1, chloroplastic n=1 Tax=Rhododendron vialii TaxID=182163 RepID=UPI00265DFF70|nr:pentatricopeptide repeat-containing protein MRL1, chloroplastic [Rhododendron vialii]
MDATFSAKSHSLSVTSLPSASSPPCSSSLRPVRREFLGCGHNLRPPGLLRSNRKCKELLGLQMRSPRFLVRASLDSQSSLLVVTVVTVSALAFVSLSYSDRTKRKNVGEVSSPLLVISQQVRSIIDSYVKNQNLGLDLETMTSADESKYAEKETSERKIEDEEKPFLPHLKETAFMHQETLIDNAVESSPASIIVSGVSGSMSSSESEFTSVSFPIPAQSEIGLPQPLPYTTEIHELKLEQCPQETEFASELPALIVKHQSIAPTALVKSAHVEVNQHKRPISELAEVGEIINYSRASRESDHEGLYKFYEINQSAVKSVPKLNGVKTLSSRVSLQDKKRSSSLKRISMINGVKLSAVVSSHTADFTENKFALSESTEGKTPPAHYKDDATIKSADSRKSRGFPYKERKVLPQDGHQYSPQHSLANGVHVNAQHDPSRQLGAYMRLLKDGRLVDCLELLEDMESKGLLDMDKVYHVRFFKKCQNLRAVKEAFRFTRLIPNPTLSTFNMLMSVCTSSQDSEGAFEVLKLVQDAGLEADCKLYTTLISTCAKSGKVDTMFKVFHEMVNAGVEPNLHTYGALIDGCARAGQVAKAFGAYGILRSKKVKPDRVIFNALISACGQSGAVDRAFDVLAEMTTDVRPIDPDHITIGALMKACANAGQVGRAQEVYNMLHQYKIKGTPEVYTIAVNSCSQTGDWEFACRVYSDMTRNGVIPDETFLSALIDVAGHAGKLDAAFEILQDARKHGKRLGTISYSSLMGACSNAKNWQKALELYEDIKSIKLRPTVSTMNALITALCDGDQLQKALEVLSEMERIGLCPNTITYSILVVASEKKDDVEIGLRLLSQAKKDGVTLNLVMSRCLIAMCSRRFEKAYALGEPIFSFNSGRPQIDSKWASLALKVYRQTILAGIVPTMEIFSQVLGCLQLPHDASLRNSLVENLGVSTDSPKRSTLYSLVDGFGEYDPRAFSLFEEAASRGIIPCVSFKEIPIVIDATELHVHTAKVYLLTVLKGLKNQLAAGAKLPNIVILLPTESIQIQSPAGEKVISVAGRIGQAVAAMLRRLGLAYKGNESYGKIRIFGVVTKKWLQPKLAYPFGWRGIGLGVATPSVLSSSSWLGKGISDQQRNIRTGNLFSD